jgi:MarR family transcriptional regulator, temperature-dependent positive regulator of motility
MKRRKNGPLSKSPIHLLQRALLSAENLFRAHMKESEILTPRQLAVLVTVAQSEGLIQMRIAEQTGIDKATLASLMKHLHQKGLLRRYRAMDGRAKAVELTDAGRRVLAAAQPVAKGIDRRILDSLPDIERKQFVKHLQSIIVSLQEFSAQDDQGWLPP